MSDIGAYELYPRKDAFNPSFRFRPAPKDYAADDDVEYSQGLDIYAFGMTMIEVCMQPL